MPTISADRVSRRVYIFACCSWASSQGCRPQRAIAWKSSESLSAREFLGLATARDAPDHSGRTYVRGRLPLTVFVQGFQMVLEITPGAEDILRGKTLPVDSTMLEANAAMESMVHKVSQKTWRQYLLKLAKEAGIEKPSDDDLRRMDQKRKGRKVPKEDWQLRIPRTRQRVRQRAEHKTRVPTSVPPRRHDPAR